MFDNNSQYRINVYTVSHLPLKRALNLRTHELAKMLSNLGYRISEGALESSESFPNWGTTNEPDNVIVFYKDLTAELAKKVKNELKGKLSVSISIKPAKYLQYGGKIEIPRETDLVVVYFLN